MPILATGSEFEKPTTGLHNAVCCYVYDIGTQIGFYEGHETRNHQVIIGWELDQKRTEGEYAGTPFVHNEFYKLSLDSRSNLSKLIQSWFSKELTKEQRKTGMDLEKFVGYGATLNLVPKANSDRMSLASIMPAAEGVKIPLTQNAIPDWLTRLKSKSVEETVAVPTGFPAPENNQDFPPPPGPNGFVAPQQQTQQQYAPPTAPQHPQVQNGTYNPNNQNINQPPPIVEDDLPF